MPKSYSVHSYFRTKWLKLGTELNCLWCRESKAQKKKGSGTKVGGYAGIRARSSPPQPPTTSLLHWGLISTIQLQEALTLLPWQKHSNRKINSQMTLLWESCLSVMYRKSKAPHTTRRKLPNLSFFPAIQTALIDTKVSAAYLSEQEHKFSFPNNFLNILLSFPPRKFIQSVELQY